MNMWHCSRSMCRFHKRRGSKLRLGINLQIYVGSNPTRVLTWWVCRHIAQLWTIIWHLSWRCVWSCWLIFSALRKFVYCTILYTVNHYYLDDCCSCHSCESYCHGNTVLVIFSHESVDRTMKVLIEPSIGIISVGKCVNRTSCPRPFMLIQVFPRSLFDFDELDCFQQSLQNYQIVVVISCLLKVPSCIKDWITTRNFVYYINKVTSMSLRLCQDFFYQNHIFEKMP